MKLFIANTIPTFSNNELMISPLWLPFIPRTHNSIVALPMIVLIKWQVISLVQIPSTINFNASTVAAGKNSEESVTYKNIFKHIYRIGLIDVMCVKQGS